MSEPTTDPDESTFGPGGESSHDADVDTAYDVGDSAQGAADEAAPDSHAADVDAGYDESSDSPTVVTDPQDT